jgi:hypothetical protein
MCRLVFLCVRLKKTCHSSLIHNILLSPTTHYETIKGVIVSTTSENQLLTVTMTSNKAYFPMVADYRKGDKKPHINKMWIYFRKNNSAILIRLLREYIILPDIIV